MFVSNTSAFDEELLVQKFEVLGILGIEKRNCYPSARAIVHYLKKNHPDIKKIYQIGEEGITTILENNGYTVLNEVIYLSLFLNPIW